jgi:hypothetical protein
MIGVGGNRDRAMVWRFENRLFTEARLRFYSSGVLAGYILAAAWMFVRHGFPTNSDDKHCIDFTWIWISAKLAVSRGLAFVYDYSAFLEGRTIFVEPASCIYEHFNYPPTFLFFTYSLGLMSYSIAFAVWITVTLLLYLAGIYAIVPRWTAIIAALTPVPVLVNVLLGHNGFLTAGLTGLALALMECRPGLSGIFFGLLTYKPQFCILLPLVLLVSRNWRVIFNAAVTSAAFSLVAAIAFGLQAWPLFMEALVERASSLDADPTLNLPLVSIFGILRVHGVDVRTAWGGQLVITVIVAATVCAVWARSFSHSLKAATLAVGSVLAAPHAISYDLCILTIAVAFLANDGLSRGFLPGERTAMLLCWVGLILPIGLIPAIISSILLALVIRRVVSSPRHALAGCSPVPEALGPRP